MKPQQQQGLRNSVSFRKSFKGFLLRIRTPRLEKERERERGRDGGRGSYSDKAIINKVNFY